MEENKEMIPKTLQNFNFIKLHQNNPKWQKRPFGENWTNLSMPYEEATDKLQTDQSYGVMCGVNNLVVVDCDRKEIQDVILQNSTLANTFTVKTAGKGLYHFYFEIDTNEDYPQNPNYPDQPKGFKIDNKSGDRVADVQGSGTQVVGPNSKMLDGRTYEIVKDVPVKKIPYSYLKELIVNADSGLHIIERESKIKEEWTEELQVLSDPQTAAIKAQVKITDLLPKKLSDQYFKSDTGHCNCPFHTSESGKCFHITDNKVFYCFHCLKGGSVIDLQMYLNGDENFMKAKTDLMKRIGLTTELKAQVMTLLADKNPNIKRKAYELMADEFIKLYNVKTIRSDEKHEVWIYDKGIYVPNGKTYIKTFIYENLGPISTQHFDNQVIDLILKKTWIDYEEFFRTSHPSKIPVMNGILNTATGDLEPFSPQYFFFNKLPVSYDPVVGMPEKFIKFLHEILPEESDIDAIQEMFGFTLYRDYKWQKAFLLEGSGANGKSVLCRILETMLGAQNVSNLTLQSMETEKFMLGSLMNKLANIDPDLPNKPLEISNRFKNATGEDTIEVDRKFKEPIKIKNYAKMIFGCNKVPKPKDTSEGFMRRWVIVKFPYKFTDSPSAPHHKLRDINIFRKLTTDQEMNAILNWSLIGLQRLFENDNFTTNQTTKDIRRFWSRKSSLVNAFLEDNTKPDPGKKIEKGLFLRELMKYKREDERMPNWLTIKNDLEEAGIFIARKTQDGIKKPFLLDIEWVTPPVQPLDEVEEENFNFEEED